MTFSFGAVGWVSACETHLEIIEKSPSADFADEKEIKEINLSSF
jgi:hypothetical protein